MSQIAKRGVRIMGTIVLAAAFLVAALLTLQTESPSLAAPLEFVANSASTGYDIFTQSDGRSATLRADSGRRTGSWIKETTDSAEDARGFTSETLAASGTLTSWVYLPYIGRQISGTPKDVRVYPEPIEKDAPKVARHGNRVYVAWSGPPYYDGNGTVFVATSADSSWNWGQPVTTTGTVPAIATDAHGTLHIAYLRYSSAFDIYYTQSTDGGQTFALPFALYLCSSGHCSDPDIAVDADGNAYVVWDEETEVMLARVTIQGDYTVSITTTVVGTTTVGYSEPPRVAVSPSGQNVYVIWKCPPVYGAYVRTYFARSTDGGATFGPRFNPTGFFRHGEYSPDVAALGEGIVYIAWVLDQYGDIRTNFARSENGGESFSPRHELGQSGSDHDSTIAADTLGQVCVAWQQDADLYFRCSLDRGQNFLPARLLVSGPPGTAQYSPALVVWHNADAANLDAVWQDERNDYSDVFFSSMPVTP
jgi:hypothetical protein